jgi:hypothetical protein
MEDKHIFKGEYCYSFRLDVDWSDPQIVTTVESKLQEYFTRYRLSNENKKDGTKHFQGILWRNTVLGKSEPQQIRTYFKQTFKLEKGGHSLVSAKKIKSLAKYCNDKEGKGYIDFGISGDVDFGQWQNKEAEKEKLKDKFRKALIECEFKTNLENLEDYEVEETHMYNKYTKTHSSWTEPNLLDMKKHMVYQILEFAITKIWTKDVKTRPPPLSTLLHICYQEGVLTPQQYILLNYKL